MRPETCIRIVNKEMRKFYPSRITDAGSLSIAAGLAKREVIVALRKLQKRCFLAELKYDPQPMYVDVTGTTEILRKLHGISDRWRCYGRVYFLLRVAEMVKANEPTNRP